MPQTWHHGLMARWWAEFKEPEPAELAFYRDAIEQFGEPALDLACGAGRLLLPLLGSGLDVDGVDASTDMLAQARQLAEAQGLTPSLIEQPMHELDLPRRYGTIFICDSFGVGGQRRHALRALERVFEHLQPGGALVFSHDLPYADEEAERIRWLPSKRGEPEPWPDEGDRRRFADGDELELLFRERSFDPLLQEAIYEVRARRWREGELVQHEEHAIVLPAFFAQEILLMLDTVGFTDVTIQGRYTGEPATGDDTRVVFVARGPA
ncbi:MAG: class I SAM-dependent methyltransferase [Actinomycetota bacterium]|nr:class I SAM-dependent methyltransferase [Actinomycetota bacterium]